MNPIRTRAVPVLLVFVGASLGPVAAARAQGFGADPFRPYNSQYDPYVFGTAPGSLDAGSNVTINRQGVRNANQFQSAMEGLDNSNRYDRAYRAHDEERKRVYRPNAEADKNFDARRAKASDIYFQYLYERDPKRRAALFKEYNQARSAVARGLVADPGARGARRARGADAIPPAPEGRGAAARTTDDSIPAVPEGIGGRSASRPRGRRSSRAPDIPPAPPGDEPSPSDVLDRASRSSRSAAAARRLP